MDDDNRISITVCGDGGCGKSSITLRLVRSQWTSDYDPTIEDSYSVTRTIDGHPYYLSLTDTAGQEEYRGLWAASNLRSDAFLLVYDITSTRSLDNLTYFADLIAMEEETRHDAGGLQPVKIVAGNKCDLKELREVSARQGLEWARGRGAGFMETSARECVNVEETFALIVRRVVAARTAHLQHQHQLQSQKQSQKSHRSPTSPTSKSPLVGGGLFPKPKPTPAMTTNLNAPGSAMGLGAGFPNKEADISDFAERPGAKTKRRGGWWARFRAAVCCCCG